MKWETRLLGELTNIKTGKLNANAAVEGGRHPFFTCSRETYAIDEYAFDCEAILLAGNNAVGDFNVKHYKGKFNAYQRTYVITIKNETEVLYRFLYIQIQMALEKFKKQSVGAGTKFLKIGMINSLVVSTPPIEEQKRIVAILDQAFADIEKARATAEKNLKNARELFDSYLQQVFSQGGEGWVEKKIGDVTDLARGHNPPKSKFIYEPREGYVRFYQIRDGKSDKHAVYVPSSPKLHYVTKDDILMVAYRHVGGAFRGVEGAFNVALCKITNKDRKTLHDDFLFHLIPSSFIKGELLKASERSLIPSMSVKHLASLSIPIPPPQDQDEIVRKINSMERKCKLLESVHQSKVNALDELKKSILQKAFSGELTKSKGIAA